MKKHKKVILYVLGTIIFIAVSISSYLGFTYLKNKGVFNFDSNKKVELKTTETNANKNEGIYITDVSQVVENAMPSIVSITSKTLIQFGYFPSFFFGNNTENYVEGAGSGIIVKNTDEDILILTNNHVVDKTSELTVKFIDDSEVDAKLLGTSKKSDVAVISVKVKDLNPSTLEKIRIATLGDSNNLKVGNGVIAIGNALGYGQSVTTGVVSALNRKMSTGSYTNMIQIDAAINGGNSGGALLNSKGEVIGINTAKYSSNGNVLKASVEGMGFAIPISDVKDVIESLIEGKEDPSAISLGIEGYMTNTSVFKGYNFPAGFYIASIQEGSYADKSGLGIGYIVTEIDGNKISSMNDIQNVLYKKRKGDSIKLKVKYPTNRVYQEKEVNIQL